MADSPKPAPGQVAWIDLTVPNAEAVRDFYQQVTGWTASSVDMGGYADYCMSSAAGNVGGGNLSCPWSQCGAASGVDGLHRGGQPR